jgi:hypothetical protein
MLLYPTSQNTVPGLVNQISASFFDLQTVVANVPPPPTQSVPTAQLPMVLLVWGPKRILPVKLTQLSISEMLFDCQLNPTHAEVTVGLDVLTPQQLDTIRGKLSTKAKDAYAYTLGFRQMWSDQRISSSSLASTGIEP